MVMVNMYVDTQEALVHSKANLYVSRMEHRRRCLSPSIFIFFFLFFFLLRSLLRCSVILSCWGDILSETWEMKFVLSFHVTTQIPACSFANWNMASEITTARGETAKLCRRTIPHRFQKLHTTQNQARMEFPQILRNRNVWATCSIYRIFSYKSQLWRNIDFNGLKCEHKHSLNL